MEKMFNTIYENIQWIFSGIGVSIIGLFIGKSAKTIFKKKQTAKSNGTILSTESQTNNGNINTQSNQNGSTGIIVYGDYRPGSSRQEAEEVALQVFNANIQRYTNKGLETANSRAAEINKSLFNMIYSETPSSINKLQEPAVQEAILNVQKSYVKNNSAYLKDCLIELMKLRMQVSETNIEQIVLDEALKIIQKLSKEHMDILSLHLSILEFNRPQVLNRISFFEMFEKEVLPFYFDNFTTSSYYAHLQYVGCTTILPEGGTYKPLGTIIKDRYSGLFNNGFTKEEADAYMGFDTNKISKIITRSQIYPNMFQFNAINNSALEQVIKENEYNEYREKIINFFNQKNMTEQEIIEDIAKKYPEMKRINQLWNSNSSFKSMSLSSVGFAIATLNFNMKTNNDVPLSMFL